MKNLISVLKKMLTFLYRTRYNFIKTHLQHIEQIIHGVFSFEYGSDGPPSDQDVTNEVISRIMDTRIIPGIILSVTCEEPTSPSASTIFKDFCAVNFVKLNADKDLVICMPNEISKGSNHLLRLSRHATATSIRRIGQLQHESNTFCSSNFNNQVMEVISNVRMSSFTDVVCMFIRLGKELSNKTPRTIYKAYDPSSGEVIVGSVSIPKHTWSNAIPFSLKELNKNLLQLFGPNQEIDRFLDLTNKLTWAKHDTTVNYIDTSSGEERTIMLANLKPQLAGDTLLVQKQISSLWQTIRGAMAYLSSGALRGEEGSRISNTDSWFVMFEMMCFQTHSLKNECHGQMNNRSIIRYMSPSITR